MWPGTETEIELLLIRHGETKSNTEHRYLGKTDEGLSDQGRKRIKQERAKNRYPSCDIVFSSPMLRCKETAELIYPQQNIEEIIEWSEIDFGRFEGKNYKELENDPDYIRWIESNGTLPFPEGESQEEFKERIIQGFQKMTDQILGAEKGTNNLKAAIVVHGGTIMTLCSYLAGGGYFDYQVKNGEGYRCILNYGRKNIEVLKLERL